MERDFVRQSQNVISMKSSSAPEKKSSVWAIASGKGGVGKTFISSSLAITLTKLGHEVVILDLDLGGANVHTALGLDPSPLSIRNYFEGTHTLQELVTPTKAPRLSYIQGFWDAWTPSEISIEQIRALAPHLRDLNADYVIVDLGAGTMAGNLELFRNADEKIMISSPEPTSIEKTYRFIESYICHSLKDYAIPEAYEQMVRSLREHRQVGHPKSFSFRQHLKNSTGIQPDYFETLLSSPLRLIVNTCRSQANSDLGHAMKSVCYKYYDLNVDFTGAIDYDNCVWQAIRNREAVLLSQPFTPLAGQFLATCKQLVDSKDLRIAI